MRMEVCFACGKEELTIATPMRCYECVKNKIPVQTAPVRDCYWILTSDSSQADGKINSEK